MPWRAPASSPSDAVNAVAARLEAYRIEERNRRTRVRNAVDGGSQISAASLSRSDLTPGMLYELGQAMELQAASRSRTAGPVPQSWWKELQNNKKPQRTAARSATRQRATNSAVLKPPAFRPSTLREECLACILERLHDDAELLDEVAYLPASLRIALVHYAPHISPLDDGEVEALLLERDDDDDVLGSASAPEETEWDEGPLNTQILPPERLLSELDLYGSTVSQNMLARLLLVNRMLKGKDPLRRMPRLRTLVLSHSTLDVNAGLVNLLAATSLTSLDLSGMTCTLFSPLRALSKSLPSLRFLDLSHSPWLSWEDITSLNWSNRWNDLESLNLADCEQLSPSASYMDPEARALGPSVIMQILSIIRDKGRTKWLDVIA
ncbi:hypothetical protein EMMF5_000719 [Cystobasidiomycetes sp. EMM_F5]